MMKSNQFWRPMLSHPFIAMRRRFRGTRGNQFFGSEIIWYSYVVYPYGTDACELW